MKRFPLKIVAPNKVVFSDAVYMVVAPSIGGEIGLLADHMPLVTFLSEGTVKIYNNEHNILKKIEIKDGLLEVKQNNCSILISE